MNTTNTGKKAEEIAADYLQAMGYKILDRNWRRPKCEIDIVASKKTKNRIFSKERTIYFVEVKYRKGDGQGSGLDYITPRKIEQMQFAAKMWVSENNWMGSYELSALEVAGEQFEVGEFIEHLVI